LLKTTLDFIDRFPPIASQHRPTPSRLVTGEIAR
jgi:hypothetical protein